MLCLWLESAPRYVHLDRHGSRHLGGRCAFDHHRRARGTDLRDGGEAGATLELNPESYCLAGLRGHPEYAANFSVAVLLASGTLLATADVPRSRTDHSLCRATIPVYVRGSLP